MTRNPHPGEGSCSVVSTPWGILQRPGLVETRAKYPLEEHVNTVEAPKREGGFLEQAERKLGKKWKILEMYVCSYILRHIFRYLWICFDFLNIFTTTTLPKFNSSPLKNDACKMIRSSYNGGKFSGDELPVKLPGSRVLNWCLGGSFEYLFIFIPTCGNDPMWQAYFTNRLVPPPPTRRGPRTTISGFIPSYTHLQPWFFIGFAITRVPGPFL